MKQKIKQFKGWSKRRASEYIARKFNWSENFEAISARRFVWCLSTGRVGSQTLASLGSLAPQVVSKHEPRPLLFGLGKAIYETGTFDFSNKGGILKAALESCRPIQQSSNGTVYLETSPHVTFLAPILRDVFPESHFAHMIRHPADIVRSGMRRKWYTGHGHDRWRITPIRELEKSNWENDSLLEKNVWLWTETNQWISKFLDTLQDERKVLLKSENIFSGEREALGKFYSMLESAIPPMPQVEKILGKKLNSQQTGEFPKSSEWSNSEKESLKRIAGPLMEEYGYRI